MPRYRALLIGNADFPEDPHELRTLNGPLTDIRTLAKVLTDDEVGLFDKDDVQKLPNREVQPLREQLDEFFTTAHRDDVLLLYYSGHGRLDLDNRLHLCAKDTRTAKLHSTALPADDVNKLITSCAATSVIVVLDCCNSGAFKGADIFRTITTKQRPRAARRLVEAIDVFRGTPSRAGTSGRGRYVLASSRSTQLALDTTRKGELSPFTAQLVRGLREADADGYVTVTDLYRQVHRWLTEASGPTPQLRFSGEGDVIIARGAGLPRPEPPPPTPRRAESVPSTIWVAHRARTGGVDRILEVTDGTRRHTIEYRSLPAQRAEVLVDGRSIHKGSNQFELTCLLGDTEACLEVTESDFRLTIDDRRIYAQRSAAHGSPDRREELAAAIRATLLADDVEWKGIRVGVVPDIKVRDFDAVRPVTSRAGRVLSSGPIIAVATVKSTQDRVWFTDRAVHLCGRSYVVVPYEELAEATVSSRGDSVAVGSKKVDFSYFTSMDAIAGLVNEVKKAVVYQDTGVGEPPPVNRCSGFSEDREGDWYSSVAMVISGLIAFQGLHGVGKEDFEGGMLRLGLGMIGFLIMLPFWAVGPLATACGIRPGLGRSMILTAVYTLGFSACQTWIPVFSQTAEDDPLPLTGWTVRIGDSLALAIGGVDTGPLGQGPRVWGALLLAAAAYVAVVTVPLIRRRQRHQPV